MAFTFTFTQTEPETCLYFIISFNIIQISIVLLIKYSGVKNALKEKDVL